MNYLLAFGLISFVILVHEIGHYVAAVRVKIPIKIFSIGFGPKIWSFKKLNTEYRLSWIPFGGYVLPAIENEDDFFNLPIYKRMVMTIGGPIASIILPVLCLAILTTITDGVSLSNILFKPIYLVCLWFYEMLMVIPTLFAHTEQLLGVVGIVAQGGQIIGSNPLNILQFTAILSLNLGVVNLLPIPVLDGGKVLLYLLEAIHPKLLKLHIPLAIIGWIFIMGLMLYTTVADVGKYFLQV